VKPPVFLGGGRITGALLSGLRDVGYDKPIVVHDRHPEKLRQLKRQYGAVAESDLQLAVAQAGMLIIAVRPNSVRDLLKKIAPVVRPLTVISLAAGVPLSNLRSMLGCPVRWARAMPSPVCRSACGFTALAFDKRFPDASRNQVRSFFALVATVVEIPESMFDAFTVTYSSSHGYHALASLAAAGQAMGLDRKLALMAAAHALGDGIAAWREGNAPLDDLLHEAATPGGIAAAVMESMRRAGYQRMLVQALRAGMRRARKNAK
jgi:pyrroline-5-carboxylate reductase